MADGLVLFCDLDLADDFEVFDDGLALVEDLTPADDCFVLADDSSSPGAAAAAVRWLRLDARSNFCSCAKQYIDKWQAASSWNRVGVGLSINSRRNRLGCGRSAGPADLPRPADG